MKTVSEKQEEQRFVALEKKFDELQRTVVREHQLNSVTASVEALNQSVNSLVGRAGFVETMGGSVSKALSMVAERDRTIAELSRQVDNLKDCLNNKGYK